MFNALREDARDPLKHGRGIFHILDSLVAAGVLAKGRSSSKRLNRPARRAMAWLLAADRYVVPLWTISKWNFADGASCVFDTGW